MGNEYHHSSSKNVEETELNSSPSPNNTNSIDSIHTPTYTYI